MKKLKEITDKYPSVSAAAKALNVHAWQLTRWLNNDAHINEQGQLYIRTKGKIDVELLSDENETKV